MSAETRNDAGLTLRFESTAIAPGAAEVARFRGTEAISRPFRVEVDLLSEDPALDLDALAGAPASLWIERGGRRRGIHGVVAEVEQLGGGPAGRTRYRVILVPRLALLGLGRQSAAYHHLSAPEIALSAIAAARRQGPADCDAAHLADGDVDLRLARAYPPRAYTVQLDESRLDFLSRLLEHEGISYFFEHGGAGERLVLTDHEGGFAPGPGAALPYAEARTGAPRVASLSCRRRVVPRGVLLRDHDDRAPAVPLEAEAGVDARGFGLHAERGGFQDPAEGARLAAVRAEEIRCRRTVFAGEVDGEVLHAGHRLELSGHTRADFNGAYLITAVEHDGGPEGYRAVFQAVPAGAPFRPERRTPRPKLAGVARARVEAGPPGDDAVLDGEGRYGLVMPFESSFAVDSPATPRAPLAQPYGGPEGGIHFPLGDGAEVVWTCVDGDPDRPVLLGAVPGPGERGAPAGRDAATAVLASAGGARIELHDGAPRGGAGAPWYGLRAAAEPGTLREQQHLTKDDEQDQRIGALEGRFAEGGAQDERDDAQEADIATLEAANAARSQQLQALSSGNTWLRFQVPYGNGKTSYLRIGTAPTDPADPEQGFRESSDGEDLLDLNTGSLDGHFEYTSGNRTIITGGNKEEIVEGKHRIAINSGNLGLYDADPLYLMDFSQDVTGAWRKTEATHVSATQFAMGDTQSWMMGVKGDYFLGLQVNAFASLSLTMGLGIKYEHVKGASFNEAKSHDMKARERLTLRVKTEDPFFGSSKNKWIAAAGLLAGGAAFGAQITTCGRSTKGRVTAALGTAPTVGLATAASLAAFLDVIKRIKRKSALDRAENDSVISMTEKHIDLNSKKTSINIDGEHDEVVISTHDQMAVALSTGVTGRRLLLAAERVRITAPRIQIEGDITAYSDMHIQGDLHVDGHIHGQPFHVAPMAPAPVVVRPPPMPGVLGRLGRLLFRW